VVWELSIPGQILQGRKLAWYKNIIHIYRLPKPKQIVRGSVSGFFPSVSKKRSGLNCEGLAYLSGSLSMNLALFAAQSLNMRENGYQPDVGYDYGTFRDVVPVMDIVLRDTVGKT
jgi:hypothetical protein